MRKPQPLIGWQPVSRYFVTASLTAQCWAPAQQTKAAQWSFGFYPR
ncbi:hypothetical protein [Shewanella sp. NFH-SH190041]|nr:hypothetical protein [Shewanella sp. NFH-SH190041]